MRVGNKLVTVKCIKNEENRGGNGCAHRKIWLELYLSRCENLRIVAAQIAELVLPILLGGDKEIPWQKCAPKVETKKT